MRVAGIDPGTKTFDVVAVEGGKVVFEVSIETPKISRNPEVLIEAVESSGADYVVGPSGYGVPITFGDEVLNARKFAVEILLLSTERDIDEGKRVGEVGIWVYDALAKVVEHLVNTYRDRVVFIPSVILLKTVPWYRKLNKVDMGTVDKLASAFLAVYSSSVVEGRSPEETDIIVVEMGYGYVGTMAIKGGRIVDGIGGTYASTGTLSSGALDLEVAAGARKWNRWDVFRGGVFWSSNVFDLEVLLKAYKNSEEPLASFYLSFIEGVAKDVARMRISTPKADRVVVSGRHSRIDEVVKHLSELLVDMEVVRVKNLKGASVSKEAGQGYAAIGEGIFGGYFKNLVEHMGIHEACGTVVDYITHPAAAELKKRVIESYKESVKKPKLCG